MIKHYPTLEKNVKQSESKWLKRHFPTTKSLADSVQKTIWKTIMIYYNKENDKWDDEEKHTTYHSLAFLFDKAKDFDTLLKYGEYENLFKLFTSDKYSYMVKYCGVDLRLVKVPLNPNLEDLVNKCIEISASKFLTILENESSDLLLEDLQQQLT